MAKSLSSPPRWGPWNLFRSFKVYSDAKKRVGCEKQREVPEFAVEDLPKAALVPALALKDLPLGRTL